VATQWIVALKKEASHHNAPKLRTTRQIGPIAEGIQRSVSQWMGDRFTLVWLGFTGLT